MPRPPAGDRPLSSTERARMTRERRLAAGLPRPETTYRALAMAAVTALTVEERQRLLAGMLASVPESERAGYEKAGADILGLLP